MHEPFNATANCTLRYPIPAYKDRSLLRDATSAPPNRITLRERSRDIQIRFWKMKGQLFAIVAIFGLSVYTASIPAPDGAKFEYVEPETVAEHFNSKPTVRGKRTVGGVGIL